MTCNLFGRNKFYLFGNRTNLICRPQSFWEGRYFELNTQQPIARSDKTGNICPMHFSTHIATLQSTSSLLAALLLRGAR